MYRYRYIALALFAGALSARAQSTGIHSFSQAKAAGVKVNADVPGDFYCGCKIRWQGKKGVIDLQSCGYKVRSGSTLCPRGSLAISASAGRKVGAKIA